MVTNGAVFDVLGDPTRRVVLERLADGPAAVHEIAEGLPVSRPAVSKHLRLLKDAGLVDVEALGTTRLYRLRPEGLAAARDYLDQMWRLALPRFARVAEQTFREGTDD